MTQRAHLVAIAVLALVMVAPALRPRHVLAPIDLASDFEAWKAHANERVHVSNSLLSDVVAEFIPWDVEMRRLIVAGRFPWVNRWSANGAPLFSNPQAALLSPFTWPRLLLGLHGWLFTVLLKLVVAGWSMTWLARTVGLRKRDAVISGAVFMLSGFFVAWLMFAQTNVLALAPAFVAAMLRLARAPEKRNVAVLIAITAVMSAGGHPEALFVIAMAALLFVWWEAEREPSIGGGRIVPVTITSAFGFLLIAVQIVPFLFHAAASYTSVMRPGIRYPFRWQSIAGQLLPGFLGSPLRGELDLSLVAGSESLHSRVAAYIGALALIAIVVARRELRPTVRRGLLVGVAGLVLSWSIPGVPQLLRYVPVLKVLAPEYCAIPFVLFGALAAGDALAIVAAQPRRKLSLLAIVVGICGATAALLFVLPSARPIVAGFAREGIAFMRSAGRLHLPASVYEQRLAGYLSSAGWTALRRLLLPSLCLVAFGIAVRLRDAERRWSIAATAIVAELLIFGFGYNPGVSLDDGAAYPPVVKIAKSLPGINDSYIAANFVVFPSNLGTLYGVRDIIAYDALMPASQVEPLLAAGYDPMSHTIPPQLSREQVTRLAALGVRYLFSREPVPGAIRRGGDPGAVAVWELPNAAAAPPVIDGPPPGIIVGFIVTIAAAILSLLWLRLYDLPEPDTAPLVMREE